MHEHNVHAARPGAPLSEGAAHSYTPERDEPGAPMSGGEAARITPAGGRSGERLTRADRIVVTILAAMLSGTLVGFVAIGSQLVALQRQIGEVRTDMTREIGDLRTEMHSEFGKLSDRITRIETLLETRLGPAPDARDPAGP